MNTDIDLKQTIYALQHIESGEFICLLQEDSTGNRVDFLACFTDGDTALEFRAALGLQEHLDLYRCTIDSSPFSHFWLDGESIEIKRGPNPQSSSRIRQAPPQP